MSAQQLFGHDPAWHQACLVASRYLALGRGPITLRGEPGCGRRALARQLHEDTAPGLPFLMFDCEGSTDEDLIRETGARIRGDGHRYRRREDIEGTICLINVDRATTSLQRALRTGVVEWRSEPNRAPKSLSVDVQILATTELAREAIAERLEPELARRICESWVELPPLRARGDDTLIIAEGLLSDARTKGVAVVEVIPYDLGRKLRSYHWPGNVLELRSVVSEFACTGNVRSAIERLGTGAAPLRSSVELTELAGRSLADVERLAVIATLAKCGGNKAQAARVLGISRRALYDRLEKYGIAAGADGDQPPGDR